MFTGIIDDVGVVETIARSEAGRELRISSSYRDVREGESIAVNGVCLTVRSTTDAAFEVAAVTTTIDRTAIGELRRGLARQPRACDACRRPAGRSHRAGARG